MLVFGCVDDPGGDRPNEHGGVDDVLLKLDMQ